MILATAGLLTHLGNEQADRVSRAIYESTLEAAYDGIRTADLGGTAKTGEFTTEVIRRIEAKLEVWSSLS
jgi:isocitrate/isopropylmalate dehydrogenase